MHLELAKNAYLLFFQHWFGIGSDFCMLLVLVRSAFCSLDVVWCFFVLVVKLLDCLRHMRVLAAKVD
jgi:hypothetical protein